MIDFNDLIQLDNSLITVQEVIDNSPSDQHSHAQERCLYIELKEEKLFRIYFGCDFYTDLLEDKIQYVPKADENDVTENSYYFFKEGESYLIGDLVYFKDKIYEVITGTDGTEKPSNSPKFKLAKKFANEAYNYLWSKYLVKIISWSIMQSSVLYRAIKDTSKGLVRNFDEGKSKAASLNELYAFKKEARGDIQDLIDNMEVFILKYKDKYPNYQLVLDSTEQTKRIKRKHFGFNTIKE